MNKHRQQWLLEWIHERRLLQQQQAAARCTGHKLGREADNVLGLFHEQRKPLAVRPGEKEVPF
jgi:hypothetical protein